MCGGGSIHLRVHELLCLYESNQRGLRGPWLCLVPCCVLTAESSSCGEGLGAGRQDCCTSLWELKVMWCLLQATPERGLMKGSPSNLGAMAPHSSALAWKITWTEEPGSLQSMGSLRVGHDWATSLSLFTFMHWRRKWQPTPVFLPGESQGPGSLAACHLWGRTELDTTEAT